MIIDAHHHFWRHNDREFAWISDAMSIIRRDFLPGDLQQAIGAAGVDGVISVQARQTLDETNWLLDLADQNAFIQGVVGWVPLVSPTVGDDLERFAQRAKLRAVRHVLHDEPDDDYCLRDDFNRGISQLRRFNLAYDVLVFERHLPQAIQFVDRHPEQVFVVDHVAKPKIKDNEMEPWRTKLRELARRPNVYCKMSGMVTEADCQAWTPQQLRPYADVVLEAFGPTRVMFGSDWPVCLIACGYARWREVVMGFISKLSPTEQASVMGGTAQRAYALTGG
ncbi:MAG TPA: amidohydrolase family protein [Tepidisphaeraceae bacterium]|nr:amidohydrolase family protein [Tepidisphaeraceae bacterium]